MNDGKRKNPKQYLGDGVYAEFDGYGIELTVEELDGFASNVIYLEPSVLDTLFRILVKGVWQKGD